ncbi:MAG TPA: transcriptional repressor LexA [Verrucomicrobiae bacterium]|jgi:repressor LexA|nr:transcriptional repressor LexA [Verrucomicrobiae bacterium]
MTTLTQRQQQIFDFIAKRLREGINAPTLREIASHFGFKSSRAAAFHVNALRDKGWLKSEPGLARSLRLTAPLQKIRNPLADIPLYGSIPAGFADEREQEADGCVSVDVATLGFKPTRNTFALRVTGDSMIGKYILNGDIVVLEHGAEPRNGDVVAALIDRESTLKTFVRKNGKVFLRAENPKYPDLIPADQLMIQGVFKALIRKAKE